MKVYDIYLLIVIGLLKIADCCYCFKLREILARNIAFAAFHLVRRRGHLRELGLFQTLQLRRPELRSVAKGCVYAFWHDVFIASSPSVNHKSCQMNAVVVGMEHLEEALHKGRGAILWESSVFGGRVQAKRSLHENGVSVCQVHSEFHIGGFRHTNTWISRHIVQPFFTNRERVFVKELVSLPPKGSIALNRDLLARLKNNQIICIAADGQVGHKFISLDFLGRTQWFATGMVSLARMSETPILPLFCLQEDGGTPTLVIESPIRTNCDGNRESSLEEALRQYSTLLEYYVRKYPRQYRNWHSLGNHHAGACEGSAASCI